MESNELKPRPGVNLAEAGGMRVVELTLELIALKERVNYLVSYMAESLTAVDVRLAKIEKEFERAEQAPKE